MSSAALVWQRGDDRDITFGKYNAIGLDLQGIGAQQLKTLQDRMAVTKAKLTQFQQNPNDSSPLNGLTKEELTGDIVQSGILGYFARVDASDSLIARMVGKVTSYRLPSYGRFLTAAQAHYFFGVVRSVSFPGVVMDVDYLSYHAEAKDADQIQRTNFMRQAGSGGSSAEHEVPELMFRNPNLAGADPTQPQGISAVKALTIAAIQGQKIYKLNASNQVIHNTVLQNLQIDQDVKLEIANALAASKEVLVHEKDISVNSWTGSGYVILDQETGSGAYKIAGGANGGVLIFYGVLILALIFLSPYLIAACAVACVGLMILGLNEALGAIFIGLSYIFAENKDANKICNLGFNLILGIFSGLFSFIGAYINVVAADYVCPQ